MKYWKYLNLRFLSVFHNIMKYINNAILCMAHYVHPLLCFNTFAFSGFFQSLKILSWSRFPVLHILLFLITYFLVRIDLPGSLVDMVVMFSTVSPQLISTAKPSLQLFPGRNLSTHLAPKSPNSRSWQSLVAMSPLGPEKTKKQFYLGTQALAVTIQSGSAHSK